MPTGSLWIYKGHRSRQKGGFLRSQDRVDPLAYTPATRPSWHPPPPTRGTGRPNISPLRKSPLAGLLVCPEPCLFRLLSRRLALSQAAFSLVRCLSAAGKGISPHLCHRLAYCLIFPILSYGADLFTPTKGLLNKMEVNWRQVQ